MQTRGFPWLLTAILESRALVNYSAGRKTGIAEMFRSMAFPRID
jgi:hypothetical protein